MPFALIIVGIVILVTAIRGTTGTLFTLIKSDFTGSDNYLYWVVAILGIGSMGYIKKLQPLSDAFLALLLVVLFLSNKGFFTSFMTGLSTTGTCAKNSSSGSVNPVSAIVNSGTILGNQAAASSNNVTATPGQSWSTAWKNTLQNFGSAINSGSSYSGD